MKATIFRSKAGKPQSYRARVLGGYLIYWPKDRRFHYFT